MNRQIRNYFNKANYHLNPFIFPKFAKIIDVSPRDGLQSLSHPVSLQKKIGLINGLRLCGIKEIEIGSLVNPKKVPNMADTPDIIRELTRIGHETFSVLVPTADKLNFLKNQDTVNEIVLFVSATETFNKKNINATIDESFTRFRQIVNNNPNLKIRGSISCCLGCPFEGEVKVEDVVNIVRRYVDLGVNRIDIADTIGTCDTVKLDKILKESSKIINIENITGHFHDSNGNAMNLVEVGLVNGMTTYQSSLGNLGGCPFSSKIVQNISTEKLVHYFHTLNIETGINELNLKHVNNWIKKNIY
jgi:hydroxymethylglutaryl-CoA lyase